MTFMPMDNPYVSYGTAGSFGNNGGPLMGIVSQILTPNNVYGFAGAGISSAAGVKGWAGQSAIAGASQTFLPMILNGMTSGNFTNQNITFDGMANNLLGNMAWSFAGGGLSHGVGVNGWAGQAGITAGTRMLGEPLLGQFGFGNHGMSVPGYAGGNMQYGGYSNMPGDISFGPPQRGFDGGGLAGLFNQRSGYVVPGQVNPYVMNTHAAHQTIAFNRAMGVSEGVSHLAGMEAGYNRPIHPGFFG